jgi:arylformamidase
MRFVDLSFTIEEGMPVYPGDIPTSVRRLDDPKIVEAGWMAHSMTLSCHAGTHIESPAHSIPGGKMLSAYPLDAFWGKATTIARDEIGRQEVKTPILALYSGYDQWWGDEKYSFPPPLTREQAEWISRQEIKVLGSDTISVGDITIHRIIQERGILIVESLCNLKQLVHQECELSLFPLKVTKEASPIRAIARLD